MLYMYNGTLCNARHTAEYDTVQYNLCDFLHICSNVQVITSLYNVFETYTTWRLTWLSTQRVTWLLTWPYSIARDTQSQDFPPHILYV